MTSQRARDRLAEQIQAMGVRSEAVLDAIRFTPRHVFVDEALYTRAYDNSPLPIGLGQTISQPYIVARMTELLLDMPEQHNALPPAKVLEIGTGCGYQTAILAQLVATVFTVERIAPLARQAEQRLSAMGLNNIHYLHGDGYLGWPEHAPFDAVLVSAAPPWLPPALIEQLRPGGVLVIPVGNNQAQQLLRVRKTAKGHIQEMLEWVSFVPLRAGIT